MGIISEVLIIHKRNYHCGAGECTVRVPEGGPVPPEAYPLPYGFVNEQTI